MLGEGIRLWLTIYAITKALYRLSQIIELLILAAMIVLVCDLYVCVKNGSNRRRTPPKKNKVPK